MDRRALTKAVDLTIEGNSDASGKTALDDFLEQIDPDRDKQEIANELSDRIPQWVGQSARYLQLARQIVRRIGLKDRLLAEKLRRILGQAPLNSNTERRLWTSLILMDLGFPRTVAALNEDKELKNEYIGEWLTLVAANGDYSAVEKAYVGAVMENRISVAQLCLKAEVIRQRFGEKLREFFIAILSRLPSNDRVAIADAAMKMYGFDLSSYLKAESQASVWWSSKTEDVINRAYRDAA